MAEAEAGVRLRRAAPPERWTDSVRVRSRSIKLALAHIGGRVGAAGKGRSEGTHQTTRIESSLQSNDGEVIGRPDRVETDNGSARIFDVKTGRRTNSEISEPERRQLLFYAYLWNETTGTWPLIGTIETAEGAELDLEISPEEARQVVS